MANKSQRLSVSLTPEGRAALERLSAASGIASSQFISKLVHDSVPVIDALAAAFAAASSQPEKSVDILYGEVGRALAVVARAGHQLDSLDEKLKLRRRPVRND